MGAENIGKGESPQVRAPVVVGIIVGLIALLLLIAFGFALPFANRIGARRAPQTAFPLPGVISYEHSERLVIEARQQRALQGARGRMPIDQAMARIAGRCDRAFDPVPP